MSSVNQIFSQSALGSTHSDEQARWYAVHTRCRHEKRVDTSLQQSGLATFLPTLKEVHYWSDRRQVVEVPLFTCYTFVYMDLLSTARREVLRTPGVLGVVGGPTGPIPIPGCEIEQVQRIISERIPLSPYPFLKLGQRVRVRGGALDGMEGILSAHKGSTALVISVDAIQRSVSVCIDGYAIEPA